MFDAQKSMSFQEFFDSYTERFIDDHKDDSLSPDNQAFNRMSERMGFVSGGLAALKALHNRCINENRLDIIIIVDEEFERLQKIGDQIAAEGMAIVAKLIMEQ